jgi:hypothetical protein
MEEPDDSIPIPLIIKPASGYDPEPVPSIFYPHTHIPKDQS